MRYLNWGIRIIVLAAVIAAVWHWGPMIHRKYFVTQEKLPFIPTAKARGGEFVISLHQLGNLKAEKSAVVTSDVAGRITYVVPEGINVKPGQILVELDTTEVVQRVHESELKYENSETEVAKAKEALNLLKESNKTDITQQEAQLDFDKSELEIAKQRLVKKQRQVQSKLIAATELEGTELEVRSKELAVKKGTMQLEMKKKQARSDEDQKLREVENAEFQANMAKEDLERNKRQLGQTTLRAPAAGLTVLAKMWTGEGHDKIKVGDQIYPRFRMIDLPDLSSMLVSSEVGESDAPRLHLGMPTLIRLDAIPDRTYHGKIAEISSLATEKPPWESSSTPGKKNFEVSIKLQEADPVRLKPGMTADVEFIAEQIPNSVYVPLEAVFEKEGKTIVYVRSGDKFPPVQVQTGKENDNFVIIKRGLKKGEIVALRDPTRSIEEQELAKPTTKKPAAPMPTSAKK